jgi:hypothetical protein
VVACGTAEADVRAPEVDEPEDETEGHQGHQQPQDHQHPLQEFCSKIRTNGLSRESDMEISPAPSVFNEHNRINLQLAWRLSLLPIGWQLFLQYP